MAITMAMRVQITQLYVSLFSRAPEAEGLAYWVSQLDAGIPIATIAQQMYDVPPSRVSFPLGLTNEEIVTKFYQNVLGRAPDDEGLTYWASKMLTATKGSVIVDMITAVVNTTASMGAAALESQYLFNYKVIAGLDYAIAGGASTTNSISVVLAAKMAADASAASVAEPAIFEFSLYASLFTARNASDAASKAVAAAVVAATSGTIADAAIASATTPELAAIAVLAAAAEANFASASAIAADEAVVAAFASVEAAARTIYTVRDDAVATAAVITAAELKAASTAAVNAAAIDVAAAALLPNVVVVGDLFTKNIPIPEKQTLATISTAGFILITPVTANAALVSSTLTIPDSTVSVSDVADNIFSLFPFMQDFVNGEINFPNTTAFPADAMEIKSYAQPSGAASINLAFIINTGQNIKLMGLMDLSNETSFANGSWVVV